MKAAPLRLTTPYPTALKIARTLGASKSELDEVRRLVQKALTKRAAAKSQPAKRADAR